MSSNDDEDDVTKSSHLIKIIPIPKLAVPEGHPGGDYRHQKDMPGEVTQVNHEDDRTSRKGRYLDVRERLLVEADYAHHKSQWI